MGIFVKRIRIVSSIVSFMVYYSFLFARIIGVILDGIPGEQIVEGMIGEFVFGSIALVGFIKFQEKGKRR